MVHVAAAYICENGKFLIGRRPMHKARGGLWEFVGGKCEPGETPQMALVRECFEELGVTVLVLEPFMELLHRYPDLDVLLTVYRAKIVSGTPQTLEHSSLAWISPDEIDSYDFCPADVDILQKIKVEDGREVRTVSENIRLSLWEMRDEAYRNFQSALIPTENKNAIIGVRIPKLRAYAKRLRKNDPDAAECFLNALPHTYYEENLLHGFLIESERSFPKAMSALERYVPLIDNWATCDSLSPKAFSEHREEVLPYIRAWLATEETYPVRFAVRMLMQYFPPEREYFDLICNVQNKDYYVRMAIAWYFATALAVRYEETLPILTEHRLEIDTHNKTVRKAIESDRIPAERKAYLKTLKRKDTQNGTSHS